MASFSLIKWGEILFAHEIVILGEGMEQRFLKLTHGEKSYHGRRTAQHCLLLSLLLHVSCKLVITCGGEPINRSREALGAHSAVSALVQVLQYFIHGQRVFLISDEEPFDDIPMEATVSDEKRLM